MLELWCLQTKSNLRSDAEVSASTLNIRRRHIEAFTEDNRLRIIAMLYAVDYEAKHKKLQDLRHAGTGEWLRRQAAYVDWKTPGKSAFLCCRGIRMYRCLFRQGLMLTYFLAGCGKSILAYVYWHFSVPLRALKLWRRSNLVDNLMGSAPAPPVPASDIVYYYCDYADHRTLQLDRILGSLLKQLFLNHQIPEHIESQLLQIYGGGTRSPAEKELSDILCSSIALRSDVCLVFDGIDECEKKIQQEMLKIFRRLASIKQCNFKIVLTCVEEGPVAHHLYDASCVQISPKATAEDITAFITSSVRSRIENGDLRIRNSELEQEIVSELVLRACGMYVSPYP